MVFDLHIPKEMYVTFMVLLLCRQTLIISCPLVPECVTVSSASSSQQH